MAVSAENANLHFPFFVWANYWCTHICLVPSTTNLNPFALETILGCLQLCNLSMKPKLFAHYEWKYRKKVTLCQSKWQKVIELKRRVQEKKVKHKRIW